MGTIIRSVPLGRQCEPLDPVFVTREECAALVKVLSRRSADDPHPSITTWLNTLAHLGVVNFFAFYSSPVFNLPEPRFCHFAVRCKRCGEAISAPIETMPDTWIVAEYPLCGERRAYLPADVFRGQTLPQVAGCREREAPCSTLMPTGTVCS